MEKGRGYRKRAERLLATYRTSGLLLLGMAIALAVLSPVVWLVLRAADLGIGRIGHLLLRPTAIETLVNSVALVGVVTGGSILIGVPLAILVVRTDVPVPRAVTVVGALPIVVPSYIGAFAFVSAFGPQGILADALGPLGGIVPTIYGFEGAALVLTLFTYPYVFIATRAALLTFDARLVEAARTLDRGRLQAFRAITLPRILPGIAGGALLVALYTLSDFGTPAIMHFDTFTRVIFVEYNTFARDLAALLSLQLLAVTALVLAIESRIGSADAEAYTTRSRGGDEALQVSLGRWRWPALLFPALVGTVTLAVPLAVLVGWLLLGSAGVGGAAGFQLTYALNSVSVSAAAALLATLAALPVAYLSAHRGGRLARLIERSTYVGYAMPGIVLGLALVYFGAAYVPALYQTIPLLLFAYLVRFLPQSVSTVRSSLLQVDTQLVESARTLGTTPLRAFRRVTLPLVLPGVAAGGALVFLTTMKELPATLMLHPTGFETIVTYLWTIQASGSYGSAAVPAILLVGLSGLSIFVLLERGRFDV
ncbi:MAG: ABC transporter permease [Halodesulfurarchaeum sp.]